VGARAAAGISCPSRKGALKGRAALAVVLLASGSSFHFGFISVPTHVLARSGELIKRF